MNNGPLWSCEDNNVKKCSEDNDDKNLWSLSFRPQQEKLCYKIVRDISVKVSVFGVICLNVAGSLVVGVRNLEASQLGEGLVQVLADSLVLLLFCQKFVFQSVDLLLELGNCPLSLGGTVLSILELGSESTD